MPTVTYNIISNKNTGLLISPQELATRYFHGIALADQSGNQIQDETLEFYIKAAQAEIEGFLNLKLFPQIIEEELHYFRDDYKQWGNMPTSYPVRKALKLVGFLGKVEAVEFPQDWLSARTTNDEIGYARYMNVVPTSGTNADHSSNTATFTGVSSHLWSYSNKNIPNYWTVTYCTSLKRVPEDIMDFVGKLAAINIFNVLGDLIIGAGIANQSIGIDGLSQSIGTTASATSAGYGARIISYLNEMKMSKKNLKAKYDGFELTSM